MTISHQIPIWREIGTNPDVIKRHRGYGEAPGGLAGHRQEGRSRLPAVTRYKRPARQGVNNRRLQPGRWLRQPFIRPADPLRGPVSPRGGSQRASWDDHVMNGSDTF